MSDPVGSREILFVLWDGGGNIPPQLTVASGLANRGHTVRILAPRVLRERVEAGGCTYVPYSAAPEHEIAVPERDLIRDWEARTPPGAAARVRDRLIVGTASAFARDVLDAAKRHPTSAVVTDYVLLGAYLGAERAGIPLVSLIHHIYPFPAPGLPPFGMGFQPAKGALDRLRDEIFRRFLVRFYDSALPRLNESRAALGLRPLRSLFDLFHSPDRMLVLTSKSFDFPAEKLPPNVRYVGAQLDASPDVTSWESPWSADDQRPLVVVSLSTTFQRQGDAVRRVIDAVAGQPVRALVTIGPSFDPVAFAAPPNVAVERYVPHSAVLPRTDLVVTHGGHGTVMAALSAGVPVICLPMGRDQGDVAARAVWHGAGIRIPASSSPAKLRSAIREALANTGYREAARRLAGRINADSDPALALEAIEQVATPPADTQGGEQKNPGGLRKIPDSGQVDKTSADWRQARPVYMQNQEPPHKTSPMT